MALLMLAWLAVVGAGMAALIDYSTDPGHPPVKVEHWPVDSKLTLDRSRPTLVMLVHPYCPCTRASIGELARIMTRANDKLRAYVLVSQAPEWKPCSIESDIWRTARTIPGVTVLADPSGAEAQRFGARTSGHVCLYTPSGELVFSGGITQARGHSGDNHGESAVNSLANHSGHAVPPLTECPVFGCPLLPPKVSPTGRP